MGKFSTGILIGENSRDKIDQWAKYPSGQTLRRTKLPIGQILNGHSNWQRPRDKIDKWANFHVDKISNWANSQRGKILKWPNYQEGKILGQIIKREKF